jgi:hypothetical protein
MTTAVIAFYLFAALSAAFALALLWRLLPRPGGTAPSSHLATHVMSVQKLSLVGVDGDSAKVLSEAIAAILKALAEFGTKLDTLGLTAILAVFTMIFAVLTWLSRY